MLEILAKEINDSREKGKKLARGNDFNYAYYKGRINALKRVQNIIKNPNSVETSRTQEEFEMDVSNTIKRQIQLAMKTEGQANKDQEKAEELFETDPEKAEAWLENEIEKVAKCAEEKYGVKK